MKKTAFDWDSHGEDHILDVAGTSVLFVYSSIERMVSQGYDFEQHFEVNRRQIGSDTFRFEFHNGASLVMCSDIERLAHDFEPLQFHRIVIEDAPQSTSDDLRKWLELLNDRYIVEPRLYLTYSNDATVYRLTPDPTGQIDDAIHAIAEGRHLH